jgi:glucose-6-phosphate 1-dehydrogenase
MTATKNHLGDGPKLPQVIVLVGATGDLARRKLLPGLYHLARMGFLPGCRIIGVSLEDLDAEGFRRHARSALDEFATRKVNEPDWGAFAAGLDYVPLTAGPAGLAAAVRNAHQAFDGECNLLHYLSVPPSAALPAVKLLAEADLVKNSRVIMEKPFGTDLASARSLNARLHEVFAEDQIFRIDHFLGKEPAQNILAFRFANGLFEPIWNRNFIDHVQIDVPEKLGLGKRSGFYEATGAYRDMVVTHLFQILAFTAMEPPTALEPQSISEEKNKVFRSMLPVKPGDVVRGQYTGYRSEAGVDPESDTETFIALKCWLDNWRWAGVPFYLRTGKRMAEGQRIISIAFREAPKSMFPPGSGVGSQGPDHLTFDLADASKMSLSFYGKRPGPGMRLDKLSLQFAMHDTERVGDVLEAYERLILDAMRGDHTLFTTSDGIERLWEVSVPLLQSPPPVRGYARIRGALTPSISSSPRTPGGCLSREAGAIPIPWVPEPDATLGRVAPGHPGRIRMLRYGALWRRPRQRALVTVGSIRPESSFEFSPV